VLAGEPRPIRINAIADQPSSVGFPPGHPPMASFLGAPIKVRDQVYGNIYLTDKNGADEFTADDEIVIEALALAAGIAVENARLHQRAGEVAVYEERDRLARDLHDGVIQRLFAIGLSLQGMTSAQAGRAVADSISAVVDDIDETIRQVRATIFELGVEGRGRGIRAGILSLVDELSSVIGFRVPVEFAGPVDSTVTDAVAEQLLPTLREALSNVARHAQATEVGVRLHVSGRHCRLEVRDNGTGMIDPPEPGGGHGLPNMRSRAVRLGGSFEVLQPPAGGTTLVWQVPLEFGDSPLLGEGRGT
jgi:signal transduction histidine kinase